MTGTIGFESGMCFEPPEDFAMLRFAPGVKHMGCGIGAGTAEIFPPTQGGAMSDLFTLPHYSGSP
jgi:hypothetical protein